MVVGSDDKNHSIAFHMNVRVCHGFFSSGSLHSNKTNGWYHHSAAKLHMSLPDPQNEKPTQLPSVEDGPVLRVNTQPGISIFGYLSHFLLLATRLLRLTVLVQS